jgi:hypothetical protein
MTSGAKVYENQPARDPDLAGMGRACAWRIEPPEDAPPHAGVGQWLVHAPHSHPWWPWYAVQAVHLRAVEGKPAAHLQFPGATHEWLVLALNPEEPLPDIDRWGADGTPPMRHLEPVDQCVQFIVADDEQASELVELTVRHILEGVSCDQDFRGYWQRAVATTAEHVRLGGHPEQERDRG